MAFTDEGNFLLKDMIIRSDFRLVDVDVRTEAGTSRQRVSSLLQRQIAAAQELQRLRDDGVLPPGVPGILPPVPGLSALPGVVSEIIPEAVGAADVVVGSQIYTVRGDSSTATVFRGPNIIADGFLIRVSGELVHSSDVLSTDEGITFLISDSDVQSSIGRLGGDHDLINMGVGLPVVGDHGIGLINRLSSIGYTPNSQFDVRFHHPVRSGQRLCVEQDVAVGLHFYAVFEVVQFSGVRSANTVLQQSISTSLREDPTPAAFIPVIMQRSIRRPGGRIVESLPELNQLLMLGWIIVGQVDPDFGVIPT